MSVDYSKLVTDDDHKKKIESTEFVFIVAPSGVGKTFTADYLGAIQGWTHIDGDIPIKNQHLCEHWKNIFTAKREAREGKSDEEKLQIAKTEEFYAPHMFELARLMLEGAKESPNNKVVLSQACYLEPQRLFFRKKLIEAGAKEENITMLFLHCDRDVHDRGAWKRWNFQAACAGLTTTELFSNLFKIEGVVDYETFVTNFQDFSVGWYTQPQESERPYKEVDVTARNVTVLDSIDRTLGLDGNNRPNDLTYEEIQEKIKAIDEKRDMESLAGLVTDKDVSKKEKEVAETEPKKYLARRSSLLEAEKLENIRHMAGMSDDDGRRSSAMSAVSNKARRQSFLEIGKFDE